jgi:hypothetical protein
MAFGINDKVVGEEEEQQPIKLFGAQDTVVEDVAPVEAEPIKPFGVKDKEVKKEVRPSFENVAPESFESTFELEMGLGEQPQEVVDLKPKEIPKTKFEDLVKDQNFNVIKDYAEARFGEEGKQRKGESKQEYIKRWMTAMRQTEWNTTLNAVPELNWLYNANKKDVAKAAKAWQLYDTIPDWYDEGGQPGVRPFYEATLSAISDPTNLLSVGIGSFARYKAARAAIGTAMKERVKAVGLAAGAEAAIGAAQSAVDQQIEIKTGRRESISGTEIAISSSIGAIFGGLEARAGFGKAPKKTTKQDLEEVLAAKKPKDVDPTEAKFTEVWDKELEQTLTEFDKFEGRQTLDKLSPPTDITEAQVQKNLSLRSIEVAKYILLADPNFRDAAQRVANKEQKVSDAIKDVFMTIEQRTKEGDVDVPKIDDTIFEAALERANINLKEFAEAARTTVGDGATIMQGYSAAAKIIRRAMDIDPEAKKLIDNLYGRSQEVPSSYGWLGEGIRRIERESKALVTSAIGTTMRNMMGTTVGLSFDAAKNLLESSTFAVGKTIKAGYNIAVRGEKYEKGAISKGISDIVKDSFNTLTYLTNAGITAEVTDAILKHNPRIQRQIFHALQETGNEELSAVSRFASTFNVAQDVLFRRAIFTASIERQMRRAGMDMYEILAQNKRIPADVIKNAADQALMGTFSFMPKKGIANNFVRFFEAPGMSLINPFPRFMVNAISFQMKYNPVVAGARMASDASQALLKKNKDPAMSERLGRRAVERMSEGIVGGAAILAAYQYRSENEDLKAWELKNDDGSVIDTRAIFPVGPILIMGDLFHKLMNNKFSEVKVRESLETLAGMKIPGGTQFTLLENLPELAEGVLEGFQGKEADKALVAAGRLVGDFVTRFIKPLQPLNAFVETFDKEMQIARDPNVITSDDLVMESAMNRVKAKFPIEALPEDVVEPLPEAVSYFREGPPVRAGEFFNTLTGLRAQPAANRLEKEVKELNIEPYTFFPSSGLRTLDREIIKSALPYVEELVFERMDREDYKDMSIYQKRIAFQTAMREAIATGREEVMGMFEAEQQDAYHKLVYNRLPADQRRIINAAYARDNDGRSIVEDKAYDRHYEYAGEIEMLQ